MMKGLVFGQDGNRGARLRFLLFSLALSCALVLGLHIRVSNPSWGGVAENTVAPWSWRDLLLFLPVLRM